MIKPKTSLFLFACFSFFSALGQDNSTEELKNHFKSISIQKNHINIPKIAGYDVKLIGSDNQAVIDLKGNVTKPLIRKSVNLLFKVVDNTNQTEREIPAQNIVVEGQYESNNGNKQPFVIPSLREWVGHQGKYQFSKTSRIVISDTSETSKATAQLLKEDIKKLLNLDVNIVALRKLSPKKGDVVIKYSDDKALAKEGYRITIGDALEIAAPQYTGKVFGTRTLLQLLEQDKKGLQIPKGLVRDYPTYEVRGFMLDVGRKFFTIDFLNDYVELMSYYKMSNFHIHLNDNGFKQYFDNDWNKTYAGFRLENSTYPNLASKDGHYTKKEFVDLQKKALRYGITIIPEIDVPAHSLAIAHAIPEVGSQKYGMDHLDLHNPKSYEVVKNILDEYTKGENPVFIGEEVHVGTDEYAKAESEKFREFTDFVFKVVQDNGKKVRAWGALTHAQGKTPVRVKDVTLNMWYNGYADPHEMKKLGYKQISTPDGLLYIVPNAGYYYDYLNTDELFNKWTPRKIGNVVFEKGDPIVRGGSFAVWNDIAGNGISDKDVHNRVFPAMQTLAQKMWTAEDSNPSLFDFNTQRQYISEAPGLNMRGNYSNYPKGLIYHLSSSASLENLAGTDIPAATKEQDALLLPVEEIGEEYTVSFWIKPNANFEGVLFQSKNAEVSYDKQKGLSYQRDGYTYPTNILLPSDKWTFITVTGDRSATRFYVNGALFKDNTIERIELETKGNDGKNVSFKKIKTLVFPLAKFNLKKAEIKDLKIYNTKLKNAEIANAFEVPK